MSRGFSSSPHNNTNNNGNNGDGTDNGDAVLLAEGKVVEVTNHFDAAAAISAALASSHLAQATGVDESSISRSAANDKMQSYKRTSSSDSYARVKKGLPTPAEAAAEMRQRRTSYESLDESDRGAEMVHKTDEAGDVETTGQQAESVGEKEADDEQQMSKKNEESDPKEKMETRRNA
ncbi:hypothetical protein QTG54_004895 [Skeletonema marinoi]|uniref:Uncharacterized protein n=1 Tax=Skeletonema marinoi TaxID=267567 RepID=A0AAD8YDU5_9STRA|nr:hypothetical protein QTG54_004895 [Skeletonema marinoi]